MNQIRAAVVISATLAVGACGAASDADEGLSDVVPAATEVESAERMLAEPETTGSEASPRATAPETPSPNVSTTTAVEVPASEPPTTTTTVEAVDIDGSLDALESLNGLIGQLDTEIESYELEEEGVNP